MPYFLQTSPLTQPKRDSWLRGTIRSIGSRIKTKFALGRAEYGTDFGEQTSDYLLDQMEQEAIDLLMYVRELKRRRQAEYAGQQETLDLETRMRADGEDGT